MSIQMSANVDVKCQQGSLQMSMEMSKIYRFVVISRLKNRPKTIGEFERTLRVSAFFFVFRGGIARVGKAVCVKKSRFFGVFRRDVSIFLGADSKNVNVN